MRVELTGRRGAPMENFTLKEDGREIFELDSSRRDGVRVETLDCDEKVGFERRPSGSAGPKTAAEAMVAALNIIDMMIFIFKLGDDLGALRMFSLTACLWWDTKAALAGTPF